MKVPATKYRALMYNRHTKEVFEEEGCYTGTQLKGDLRRRAESDDCVLLEVERLGKERVELEAQLFIRLPGQPCDKCHQNEEVTINE